MAPPGELVIFASLLAAGDRARAPGAAREHRDRITLWLFGGVAQFKGAFTSADFRIAIVGPLVSRPGSPSSSSRASYSGASLVFIGSFLLEAATAEARYIATRQALDGLRVRDLMVRDPATVESDLSFGQFMDELARSQRCRMYPVLDHGRSVGLLAPRQGGRSWKAKTQRRCTR